LYTRIVRCQVTLNRVPIRGLAQLAQDDGQAIIREIGVADAVTGHALQGVACLPDPIADGQFPMIALRHNMRQPDRRHPAPTQPFLKPVAWNMSIQDLWQVQLQHDMNQQSHRSVR